MKRMLTRLSYIRNIAIFPFALAALAGCCCTGSSDEEFADTDLNLPSGFVQLPPEASGTATSDTEDPLLVNLDATSSFDSDGEIVQYDWDFDNDGEFDLIDGGPTPSFEFAAPGTYTVVVRVTDNDGLTDTAEIPVTIEEIPAEIPNEPPIAALSANPESGDAPLEVTFDASASNDPDGTIVQYDWDMDNDGGFEITDGGPTQAATYEEAGTYTAGVRVTDNDGLTDTATASVTVSVIELFPPVAALSATPDTGVTPLEVIYDASASTDSDGTIVQYDWDMDNDGGFEITDGGPEQTAAYDSGGVYTAGVRVTDNDGLSDSTTASVDANEKPVANLTATPTFGNAPGLEVTFDASGSTDGDGTIEQYEWDMENDGTFEITDGGPIQIVVYDSGSIHTVVVRVTDNDGLQDTASADVDVNNPPLADLLATPDGGVAPLSITYDASGSTDGDGTIVQYDWDLDDDGTFEVTDGGPAQEVPYQGHGTFAVSVRVIDDDGAQDTASTSVDVLSPPIADLVAEPPGGNAPELEIIFDASASFDPDGTIVQYDWDMDGDGTFELTDGGTMQTAFYNVGGLYTVNVRVTDNDGLTGIASVIVDVNEPPTAIIQTDPDPPDIYGEGETVAFDATSSFDVDGTVVQYDWDLDGDGTYEIIDGSPMQTHYYFIEGGFPEFTWVILLRVIDDDGAEGYAFVEVYASYNGNGF